MQMRKNVCNVGTFATLRYVSRSFFYLLLFTTYLQKFTGRIEDRTSLKASNMKYKNSYKFH